LRPWRRERPPDRFPEPLTLSIATDRLPLWTVVMPFVELGADLLLYGGTGLPTALALGAALLAAVLAAVHHAELVALPVGEPFGAILLALALTVTVIELGLIVSIMLCDQPEPTLLRDTIHAVVVLVLHGMAGLCIVVGALRHREQAFRTQGAQAYLIVLLPMVAITLVLPNFTPARRGRTATTRSGPSSAWPAWHCGWPSASCRRCGTASTSCPTRPADPPSRKAPHRPRAPAGASARRRWACCWWRWWRWCCWPRACRPSSSRRCRRWARRLRWWA
jgi:hypothetical protein